MKLWCIVFWGIGIGFTISSHAQLKDAYAGLFHIGVAINDRAVQGSLESVQLIHREFNSFTPENCMKWGRIHPKEDEYHWEQADAYVALGDSLNMVTIGHTLVWHNQLADWVGKNPASDTIPVDSAMLSERIEKHIRTIMGRYQGRVHGWDVVNEALNEDGTYRESLFYQVLGESFIANAFAIAAEVDSGAELYYNDYNLAKKEKREGTIRLVKEIQRRGIKIDGIGMQGHWHLEKPSIAEIEESIIRFSELGMKIMITELDISVLPNPWDYEGADLDMKFEERPEIDPYTQGLPDSIETVQARRYRDLFDLFIKHQDKISRITFWGLHDGVSWLNYFPVRGRTNYPLVFDRKMLPKKAYHQLIEANAQRLQP